MMKKKELNSAFATGRLDQNRGRRSIHNATITIYVPTSNLEVSYNEIRLNVMSSIRKLFLASFFPQYFNMQSLVEGIISKKAMEKYKSCCNGRELEVLFNIFKDEFDGFVRKHVFHGVQVVKIPIRVDNTSEILDINKLFGAGNF